MLTPGEAAGIAALYPDDSRFRSTIDMGRYRFGEGEYRYFTEPFPEAVTALKEALYPKLLPVARDWWARLGRAAPWPDRLAEWLEMCHAAGQTKPTPSCSGTAPGRRPRVDLGRGAGSVVGGPARVSPRGDRCPTSWPAR